jgi:hypothetical protein
MAKGKHTSRYTLRTTVRVNNRRVDLEAELTLLSARGWTLQATANGKKLPGAHIEVPRNGAYVGAASASLRQQVATELRAQVRQVEGIFAWSPR